MFVCPWVSVASAKAMNLKLGDVSLVGELRTVDSRTRTAHFTKPVLPVDEKQRQNITHQSRTELQQHSLFDGNQETFSTSFYTLLKNTYVIEYYT